ncbi:anhydro-N-acetylmuramic acid kinase [Sphingobacterium sp. Mn56C]|uniref:anhydro-N-acetylmuramic acid kinase n=1 Tax=Sphingobacterium sp. Mn56C TaxID=3395261 RepID=UPI003BD36813
MNRHIQQLYRIAKQDHRYIIGLMSGTSLDGLDIALCKIQGAGRDTKVEVLQFVTMPYPASFRTQIRQVFAKQNCNQQTLTGLHAYVGLVHASLVLDALKRWKIPPDTIDIIASHGQTVFHAPQILTQDFSLPNGTLQIGDGDHIAVKTGIITVSDFRQKHIAAGGEGAPLAAYGDFLLFSDNEENRILLNIGGIANFTFLPKRESAHQAFASDIGPGNTLMNQYMLKYVGLEMDEDATLAKQGQVCPVLLAGLLQERFLSYPFPKTTGPELFNLSYLEKQQQLTQTTQLSHADVMATLNAFAATAIIQGIQAAVKDLDAIAVYISGGGLHNPLLMENIKAGLPHIKVSSISKLGINPDAKEACLFSVLANETLAGNIEHVALLENAPAVCMGKISLPQ